MVQIAFLTLFLGLTAGRQPVALTVQGPVAAVELVLDGAPVVRISGPNWRTKLDFGTALEPHELIARALDDKGQEVGRARQVLNLPRPPAEVEILLENDAKGQPAGAHLTWRSLTGEKPAAASLLLDGQPVPLDANAHATLPPVDPEVAHILSAEVRFGAAVVARRDIGFGGRWGDEVSTELTAVPVRLRPGKTLPAAAALQGWVLTDGKPVPVAAVEESPAQLLVVRDNEARLALEAYDRQKAGKSLQAGMSELQRFKMSLGKDDQIRFVWPSAKSFTGQEGVPAELFDASRDYIGKDGGLLWLLGRALPQTEKFDQRLADATAVAGLQALAGNRPRAVLLVLGYNAKDASRYDAGAVRHYLESVRVPLIVWALDKASLAAMAWGGAEDISTLPKLESTFKKLDDELAWQRILWVEGSHLPGAISLSPAAAEVMELVATKL
jgi:hypothetical protein